jgi:dTMP kinase
MTSLRGKFIVFDGTEGCGKSTQAEMLRGRLVAGEGAAGGPFAPDDVLVVRDPGTTRIGEMVRGILLDPGNDEMGMRCEMLLYMAARAQMMFQTIKPALAEGKLVLCDRFVSSTLAYQLGGDGLTAADIRAVAGVAIGGRWPDLTVLLDMPADASLRRVKPKVLTSLFGADAAADLVDKDRIERRPMAYHEQVRKNYLAQAAADPAGYRVVDADRDKQKVHEDVWRAVAGLQS